MDLTLARHALVTGGASGIGLGVVQALVDRGIAVTVADVDRQALDALVLSRPEPMLAVAFDTRDRQGWHALAREAEARFGPVDILVNNAGIGPDGREFADMDPDAFDRTIAINLTAVFNGVSAFAPSMRGRGAGHIVNVSSMMGIGPGYPTMGAYSAAKTGVVALSEALRAELAPHGVGVSVMCPGPVSSRLAETTRKAGNAFHGQSGPATIARMSGATAGEIMLRGIALDLPYIITHPESWNGVETRTAVLRASFATAEREFPRG
ncbi:SDR family oxidoreductase [Novosphingobium album (ex Liu et al. 2023)]|uniref:SDR family NAD(P)-dependent oxidoreductase n=1 Tax=Novosphingobium album (ex Liu et al. 2023) TaxID=3031130 RepID=A0ABT5WUI4_9SPHN|nr:SDR family oxidoreductase [Novosphingobium album (ex Liu et al. 2023)]MDE8653568.1 SDR family NAD(P)-dependent oxidoreductase [Novosphingobium album (ex Liu et al. 2023)]